MKRPHESTHDNEPNKKRIISHIQHMPPSTEPASQVAEFAESQLLRSLTAALALSGFDTVKPTALEMFKTHVEEYMLRFASEVRTSMTSQRRTTPTAQDFALALAHMPNTRMPSVLRPQVKLRLPETISCPSIPRPDPALAPAPDFSALLEPLFRQGSPKYIPAHFPQVPAQHAWKSTAVFPTREADARKMREKATEEGMLAEQALRRLAAAAKAGVLKAETRKRSGTALAGVGKVRHHASRTQLSNEDIFGDVLQDVSALPGEDVQSMGLNGSDERKEKAETLGISEELLVNHDAGHWRGGKRQGLAV